MSLAFDLERAQRTAYYAANYLRDHPGHVEAQQSYRDAAARVEEVIARIRQSEANGEEIDAN